MAAAREIPDDVIEGIVSAKPWRRLSYGLAYPLRRWLVTLTAASLCYSAHLEFGAALVLVGAAAAADLIVTRRAPDIAAPARNLVEAVAGRSATLPIGPFPSGSRRAAYWTLSLGPALLCCASYISARGLRIDLSPVLFWGMVVLTLLACLFISAQAPGQISPGNITEAPITDPAPVGVVQLLLPMPYRAGFTMLYLVALCGLFMASHVAVLPSAFVGASAPPGEHFGPLFTYVIFCGGAFGAVIFPWHYKTSIIARRILEATNRKPLGWFA